MAFKTSSQREAIELLREDWFRTELREKQSGGRPLWDGKAVLTTRSPHSDEHQHYEAEAPSDDGSGETVLVYLVPID